MSTSSAAEIQAAADRLRGHLVATPMIGSSWLPAAEREVDLRFKPELLQPGGSGWYRGYLHWLLRSLGSLPGVVFAGPPARALAAAAAALQHRLSLWVILAAEPASGFAALLDAAGAKIEFDDQPVQRADGLQRARGLVPFPGLEHPDVAAGLATVGLELAVELPAECEAVYAPASLASAIVAGLTAAGRRAPVVAVGDDAPGDAEGADQQWLATALLYGHRLRPSPAGLELLAAARGHGGREPVAAVVVE